MFHSHHEVLMKPLTFFITNSPEVNGEFINVTMKEMELDAQVYTQGCDKLTAL